MRRLVATAVPLLLSAGALVLSSCGSGGPSSVGNAASTTAPETNSTNTPDAGGFSGEGCTSGPADANVRVTIFGGESCAQWDKTQSVSGTFWREASFPTSNDEQLVCSMEGPGGRTLIEVRDTGEHFYGNRVCASLTSEGWHDAEGPGAKIEQSRKGSEAQAKAKSEQREEQERARANKREAEERAQEEHKREAENKKQEAEQHAELEKQERENQAQDRRSEEETKKLKRESG
ncbi:MAG TPA: hypothetical protein VNZ01_09650 [Solirubrobacteraceae bacterium]|jgi:hypothetical protein|nr:hypothetical protein [Solirubrobacteraceae bacterium]